MSIERGDTMANIGKMIYDRRTALGMSQEELAKKVGYKDRSSIAKIEPGERDIRQRKVVDFAKALKTSPQVLMGYEETEIAHGVPISELSAPKSNIQLSGIGGIGKTKVLDANTWIDILQKMSDEQLQNLHDYAEFLLAKK